VALLREHLLAGRLTLEEFSERVEIAYGAQVGRELELAGDGLPEATSASAVAPRRKPTRVTAAVLSHVVRRGRLRLRGWTVATAAFSDLDLDLREAELDRPDTAITAFVAFGNLDVYVPEGIDVRVGGFGLVGHRRDWGRDLARADAPVIRIRAVSLFGTVDIWRVPPDLQGTYGEIIRQLTEGQRRLPA
jgi:hypothetical protein